MKTPNDRIDQLVKEFEPLKDWETKYLRLIEIGKKLEAMPAEEKTEDAKVKGCQSQVWIHVTLNAENRMIIHGDSDAVLVKGLVAVLVHVFSNSTPAEVMATPLDFLERLGFRSHLSPSRTNGLLAMIKQIRMFATAFLMIEKSKA